MVTVIVGGFVWFSSTSNRVEILNRYVAWKQIDTTMLASDICPAEVLGKEPELGIGVYLVEPLLPETQGLVDLTEFEFVVVNRSSRNVRYRGFVADSFSPRLPAGRVAPFYLKLVFNSGNWSEGHGNWCGYGLTGLRLNAGRAGRFKAYLSKGERLGKIGVRCYEIVADRDKREFVVWSEPFGLEPGGTP